MGPELRVPYLNARAVGSSEIQYRKRRLPCIWSRRSWQGRRRVVTGLGGNRVAVELKDRAGEESSV